MSSWVALEDREDCELCNFSKYVWILNSEYLLELHDILPCDPGQFLLQRLEH